MIEVVNIRNAPPEAIYIGRANPAHSLAASPLANPYHLTADADRGVVIAEYRQWLWRELRRSVNTPAATELRRLHQVWRSTGALYLACWCAPLACHGDVVKRAIEWLEG